ncbi:MAG: hypothetical protein MJY69_07245 [Bacteroidales bacterium]|mgnify:CR=1 FL=1|nr:hypothetical protein [Bacteroidales bacterium]
MKIFPLIIGTVSVMGLVACSSYQKLNNVRKGVSQAEIRLPEGKTYVPEVADIPIVHKDTLTVVDPDGREVMLMRAVRDEATGEMVATEEIEAAVIMARFRNVAERHGKIDLEFQLVIPEAMQDGKWQLRLHPDMFIMEDSVRLEDVVITGREYRKAQLKGYQQYEKFISRIITDSSRFIDKRNLEIFLKRNIPAIYAFRNDSTDVSDETFNSFFGVSGREAVDHYTNRFLIHRNDRLNGNRDKMWRKYVKVPIVTDGIRLDTVLRNDKGDFLYNYVQTVRTGKNMKKADIVLSGEIFEQDRRIYSIPESEPLTFYISSVSSFVDNTERYMTKVISRRVSANMSAYIGFRSGRWEIDETFSGNSFEISRIKDNLRRLACDGEFELDSITIASFASPEGLEAANVALCRQRAASAADYFSRYVRTVRDSLRKEEGMFISVGDDLSESGMTFRRNRGEDIRFLSRSGGENWETLDRLVEKDSLMTEFEKMDYSVLRGSEGNPDVLERMLSAKPYYAHIRNDMYPELRTVRFDFALHRRGMVKDTVHTTELDTVYAKGVQCIRDRDYESAIRILGQYKDYNTAVAYVAMDYNHSAMSILKDCPRTARVDYMMALLYSRFGDDQKAVQYFLDSVRKDQAFIYRGNLDPEISALIKNYNLSDIYYEN